MLTPAYQRPGVTVHQGDALDVLAAMPAESVDAVITDPPYGLGFMGKDWDTAASAAEFGKWCQRWAEECLRVLKPGGWLVAFGGSRTWHRLAVGVEDAGFELRDSLLWLYGTGFPKGIDVAAAIDRQRDDRAEVLAVTAWLAAARDAAGWTNRRIDQAFGHNGMANHWTTNKKLACVPSVEQWAKLRELLGFGGELDSEVARLNARKRGPGDAWHDRPVIGTAYRVRGGTGDVPIFPKSDGEYAITAPALDEARQWDGWHTALKPGHEPAVLARKPLIGTVARTVTTYGTGALNIDACRVPGEVPAPTRGVTAAGASGGAVYGGGAGFNTTPGVAVPHDGGRWPTNVILTHSPACELDQCEPGCPVAELDRQGGRRRPGNHPRRRGAGQYGGFTVGQSDLDQRPTDGGGASRFFPTFRYQPKAPSSERPRLADGTAHPTVKPLALMRWLVRLLVQPGGTVLDPFAGSGTTAAAALAEGAECVAVEREPAYVDLIRARLGDDPPTA